MAKMTVKEALMFLNLNENPTPEEVKKAYRLKAKEHHPDIGGSEAVIKKVNEAYERLCEVKFYPDRQQEQAEFKKTLEEIANGILSQVTAAYKESNFLKYFEEIFEVPFSANSKIEIKKGYSSPNVCLKAEFSSIDEETFINLWGFVGTVDLVHGEGLSSGSGKANINDFPINLDMEITHGNKKVKPYRRNYLWGVNSNFVLSPEDLFPQDLMKKAIDSSKKRIFSKQDMISTLRNKLDASFDGEYMRIQIGPNYRLIFYRMVFQRVAGWGCNGFYRTNPQEKIYQGIMSLPESERTVELILEVVNKLRETPEMDLLDEAKRQLDYIKENSRQGQGQD